MSGAVAWQYHMIQYVRQYEATKPKQHPVGMTVLWPNGTNDVLLSSPADWIAPNADDAVGSDGVANPAVADGSKVIIDDTDHLCGVCGDAAWVWKSFTRGRNPILMDPDDGTYPITSAPYDASDPRWEAIRVNFGYARTYADRINLAAMVPHGELASTGYCLANPGTEYLVYLPNGGTVYVGLGGVAGTFTVEWFSPGTGQTTPGATISGGTMVTLTAPFGGDAVLYLHQ
jgi:hypothetical protein